MRSSNYTDDTESGRFYRITDIIDIKKLEQETNKLLLYGLFIAVIFHISLGAYFTSKKSPILFVQHIIVDLITVSRPRLRKPFTIKKRIFRKNRSQGYLSKPVSRIEIYRLYCPD